MQTILTGPEAEADHTAGSAAVDLPALSWSKVFNIVRVNVCLRFAASSQQASLSDSLLMQLPGLCRSEVLITSI